MHLRDKVFILRIHSSKRKKDDEGIYAELLLFLPWRDENNLRRNYTSLFNDNYNVIKKNKESIYPNSTMVDVMRELIENPENVRPTHFKLLCIVLP